MQTLFGIPAPTSGRMKLIDRQNQLKEFYNSYKESVLQNYSLPKKLWKASALSVCEVTIKDYQLNWYGKDQHGRTTTIWWTFISEDKPTKLSIKDLEDKLAFIIEREPDHIVICYSYVWGDNKQYTASTGVKLSDINPVVVNHEAIFDCEDSAIRVHENLAALKKAREEFQTKYAPLKGKRDSELVSLGYRSLGWQNDWRTTYYDVKGNVVPYDSKDKVSFGYSTEDYPEYGKCRELGHIKVKWSFNQRGSDNTVCCPVCMLFWKYDCSD